MKKIIYLMLIVFAIVGCSNKNRVLTLYDYGTYAKSAPSSKSVFIESVKDDRKNKNVVAKVKDKSDMVTEYVVLTQDLSAWYKDALSNELVAHGISSDGFPQNTDAVINLTIKDLDGTLQGYSKDNMKANALVLLEIKKGNKTITKQVSQNQSQFAVMQKGTSFTPFMQELLRDMVMKTAKEIDNVL